jgi:hypothetical protein
MFKQEILIKFNYIFCFFIIDHGNYKFNFKSSVGLSSRRYIEPSPSVQYYHLNNGFELQLNLYH